jgi:hypothetical protein
MENHTDWKDLVGQQVRIQKDGRTIRTGQVEAVVAAADALWIGAHGVDARALYEKTQGYAALPVTEERPGSSRERMG